MSIGKTKNAALLTSLAFHYQVLIGLDKCFVLQEGQSIWFEKDGDVSLLDKKLEKSVQIEVKNNTAPLTDHHENFWKTLKNWTAPEFDHRQYNVLLLHTTQPFGKTTRFKNWNTQSTENRIQIINDICNEQSKKDHSSLNSSNIKRLQQDILQIDSILLRDVLEKLTLFTEAEDITSLKENIFKKFVGIPKNNRKSYLDGLIGFVYGQAEKNSWSVSYEDFQAKCEELTNLFCKKEFTFPSFIGYKASKQDLQQNKSKLFVKKINDIDYPDVISEAIGNWIELQNSLNKELDGFPQYAKETKHYQQQLISKFKLKYSSAKDDLPNNYDEEIQNKTSRKLYNMTIGENPHRMNNIEPPLEYKNGLIQDAMDDEERDLKWKVEV